VCGVGVWCVCGVGCGVVGVWCVCAVCVVCVCGVCGVVCGVVWCVCDVCACVCGVCGVCVVCVCCVCGVCVVGVCVFVCVCVQVSRLLDLLGRREGHYTDNYTAQCCYKYHYLPSSQLYRHSTLSH
jgi:hypothetical protein